MRRWDEQACGSNLGDGLVPGAWARAPYYYQGASLLASQSLIFVPPAAEHHKTRIFDGVSWSALGSVPSADAAGAAAWLTIKVKHFGLPRLPRK